MSGNPGQQPAGISSDMLMASGAMNNLPQSNVATGQGVGGSHGGGAMGNVGGNLGMPGESQGLGAPGQGPGMDGFFSKVNNGAFMQSGPIEAAEGIAEHQAGGKFEIADAGFNKTGQGLAAIAPPNTPIVKPVGMGFEGGQQPG